MARITSENAREMTMRGLAVRLRLKAEREAAKKAAKATPIITVPITAVVTERPPEIEVNRARAIDRLEKQMARIDDQIDVCEEPDDWHKLTTARSKLWEPWRILVGIAMPGSLKPIQPRQKRAGSTDLPQPE